MHTHIFNEFSLPLSYGENTGQLSVQREDDDNDD